MTEPLPQIVNKGSKLEEVVQMALQIGTGAIDVVLISTSEISVEDDLANFCREPRCSYYGVSANCPPYVSGPAGFRDMAKICKNALAIRITVPMESLLSYEQRDIMKLLHEIVSDIEKMSIKLGYSHSKAFAVGSCKEIFCHNQVDCRLLVKGGGSCRYQRYARPPIEAFGINVNQLAKIAGWTVNTDKNADTNKISMGAVYGLVLIG
ncbi:MAG: DUF2284 domain-containing protein [Desulfosporosinus sp.]|nr:DUF2284 domain-containing protein [Desulfosporosinus sp.]